MSFDFSTFIDSLARVGNPLTFFLGGFLEEAIAPIPSAAVMLAGGLSFAGSPHTASLFLQFVLGVVLPISLGVTLGSLIFYWIGRFFGSIFVEKYGRFLGVSKRDIEKVHDYLGRGIADDLVLFVARVFPLVPSVAICIVAGVLGWPLKSYIAITFIGTFFRSLLLGLVAWNLGQYAKVWMEKVEALEVWFTGLIIALALIFLILKKWRKKQHG